MPLQFWMLQKHPSFSKAAAFFTVISFLIEGSICLLPRAFLHLSCARNTGSAVGEDQFCSLVSVPREMSGYYHRPRASGWSAFKSNCGLWLGVSSGAFSVFVLNRKYRIYLHIIIYLSSGRKDELHRKNEKLPCFQWCLESVSWPCFWDPHRVLVWHPSGF